MLEVSCNEDKSLVEQFIDVIDKSKEVINCDTAEGIRVVCKVTTCNNFNG